MPSVHWKLPPPVYRDDSKTSNIDWKDPPTRGPSSNHDEFVDDNSRKSPLTPDSSSNHDEFVDHNSKNYPPAPGSSSNPDESVDHDPMKTIPTYTTYLKLPHLLSLAWVTYPVISLIIVAFRLQLSLASAENGLDGVKSDLLASCTAAERAATAAASLPRYMAETSNRQFADAANGVLTAAKLALILSLTIVEALINFIIDLFRSLFLCLLELAMGIGLSLATDAVQALNTTVSAIGNDLATQIGSANSAFAKSIDAINKVDPFHKIPLPSISESDLNNLQNLALPSAFQGTLNSINSSMPTADQIKDAIDDLVDTPFTILKKAINNTFDSLAFDPALFPVPAENQLTFCNKLDTSSIDGFKKDLINIARYGTYIIIGLAIIITGLNCVLIWYRWGSLQGHFDRTRQAWTSDPILNPNASSPSAPQVTPSNGILIKSHPVFPSAPQAGDRNITMSQPAFPSAPQVTSSNGNSVMSRSVFPSAPQATLGDRNTTMSQPAFPSAPQVTSSNGNSVMSRPVFPSAPQATLGDRNITMSRPVFPSAPQATLGDRNITMSQPAFPSAPQVTPRNGNVMMSRPVFPSAPQASLGDVSEHILTMSQGSAPSGSVSDHIITTSKESLPQGNVSDQNLTMSFPSAPQATLGDRNITMSQLAFPSAPQVTPSNGNLMTSHSVFPSAPQATVSDSDHILTMSQGSAPSGNVSDHNLTMSKASLPQGNVNVSDQNLTTSQAAPSEPQITLSNHNLMMLQADSEHPLITRIMYILEARIGMTPTQNLDMRWFFHYVFHPPALACFLIGFFGLLSVMIQLFLLGPLLTAAREGVEIAVADISNIIVNAINATMYEQSATYANDVNSKVDVVQNAVNHGLFGWVNGTTSVLNNSINHFYTDVQNYVTHLFNGTVLENPAMNFLQCLIGNKVVDIGEALTFLQDNLVINIPRVSQDVLILSSRSVDEATGPIASGAAGSGSGGEGLLGDAIAVYQKSLMAEAQIFGIFMGLWGIVVISAISILLWRVRNRKKALEANKLQSVKTELQDPVGLDSDNVKENNFFPNDEKKDPFLWSVRKPEKALETAKLQSVKTESQVRVGLDSENMKENFFFPNDEKKDPFLWSVRKPEKALETAKLQSVKTELQVPVGWDSKNMKENNFFPNDEKKDPFMG